MRKHDQQGTPFKQNISDLRDALLNRPRTDGRGWLGAVGHEAWNVGNEAVRAHSWYASWLIVILIVIGIEWAATGTFL